MKNIKTLEYRAFSFAIAIHIAVFVFYGISIGYSEFKKTYVVSNLKISLGSEQNPKITDLSSNFEQASVINTPSVPYFGDAIDKYEPPKTLDPVVTPKAANKKQSANPTRKGAPEDFVRQFDNMEPAASPAPNQTLGQAYGNSINGNDSIRSYPHLLGYLVQERVKASAPRGFKGKAILNIHINRQGFVLSYDLKKKTGVAALDEAALQFARKSMVFPLPPVPENYEPNLSVLKYDFAIYYD